MKEWEIDLIIPYLQYRYRQNWDMARFNGYISCQTKTKKKLSPTDIIKFNWDDEDKELFEKEEKEKLTKDELMKRIDSFVKRM